MRAAVKDKDAPGFMTAILVALLYTREEKDKNVVSSIIRMQRNVRHAKTSLDARAIHSGNNSIFYHPEMMLCTRKISLEQY